jgi:hypothetical protein
VCRYEKKEGARDLEKAHHYCDIWLQVSDAYQIAWVDTCDASAIDVDTFIEANRLPATVAKIVELVCVAPGRARIAAAKALILELLGAIHG